MIDTSGSHFVVREHNVLQLAGGGEKNTWIALPQTQSFNSHHDDRKRYAQSVVVDLQPLGLGHVGVGDRRIR